MNPTPEETPQIPSPPQPPPLQAPPAPASPPQGAPAAEVLTSPLDMKTLFEGLLRQPAQMVARLQTEHQAAVGRLLLLAAVSTAAFGLVLGTFAGHEQLWAAPLKVMGGVMIAALICFPSLYIFSCLAGSRIGAAQLATCLAAALALAGILLLGFAPAVWIFTQSTDSLGFMGFLSLAAWFVAIGFAIGFLRRSLVATGGSRFGPLGVWSAIFVLVTLQMSTSLRPILGRSNDFLTSEKKFFLQHWGDCMGRSLETPVPAEAKTGAAAPASQGPATAGKAEDGRNPYAGK